MEAKKRRSYYQSSHIDGSAVRKLNTVPEYDREYERIRHQEPRKVKKHKTRRKPAINIFSFLVLVTAIGITLSSAVSYLQAQISVNDLNKSVSAKERQLATLTADNDALLSEINTSLDLKKIFDVAVKDLGMVFPNKSQIVTYERAICEYVRQYDKIPEAKAEDLFAKMFQ